MSYGRKERKEKSREEQKRLQMFGSITSLDGGSAELFLPSSVTCRAQNPWRRIGGNKCLSPSLASKNRCTSADAYLGEMEGNVAIWFCFIRKKIVANIKGNSKTNCQHVSEVHSLIRFKKCRTPQITAIGINK